MATRPLPRSRHERASVATEKRQALRFGEIIEPAVQLAESHRLNITQTMAATNQPGAVCRIGVALGAEGAWSEKLSQLAAIGVLRILRKQIVECLFHVMWWWRIDIERVAQSFTVEVRSEHGKGWLWRVAGEEAG